MFVVMREHVTQCSRVAHWCVFNNVWTTMEVCGTEESFISGRSCQWDQLLVDFGSFKGFADSKKILKYHQIYECECVWGHFLFFLFRSTLCSCWSPWYRTVKCIKHMERFIFFSTHCHMFLGAFTEIHKHFGSNDEPKVKTFPPTRCWQHVDWHDYSAGEHQISSRQSHSWNYATQLPAHPV